jgi:hypothetical protein
MRPSETNAAKTSAEISLVNAREQSQPRNGAREIFMTAAAKITHETVSAANRFGTRDR